MRADWKVRSALLLFVFLLIGCGGEPDLAPTPTLSPEMAAGHTVYQANCAICHALTADTVIRGPSLHGIATRAGQRVEGMGARDYLYTSILRPADYLVDGYENIMPTNLAKDLTGEEMDAVVNYLLTFEQEP